MICSSVPVNRQRVLRCARVAVSLSRRGSSDGLVMLSRIDSRMQQKHGAKLSEKRERKDGL